ncbi:MAG: BTAD domain-containing putative transcriptional regulator, partial [Microthrixaceae bacterium]
MVTLDEGSALIRLLGPVEAVRDGTVLALGGPRQRALLALLAVAGPQGLSAGAIADELWGGDPPEGYRTTVRSYVSRLRRALGDVIDKAPGSAYRLRLPPEAVDAHAFEGLLRRADEALAAGAPARGRDLLGRALGLWRGAPLADVGGHGRLRAESARLEDLRLHAIERRLEADIALGRGDQVVEELEALVGAHPFRERLWGHLMLALYHADRQAEALEAYQRARRTPPRSWARAQRLSRRPRDRRSAPRGARIGPAGPRVRLPAAVTSFVGREAQLVEVEALLGEQRWATLTGVGGVGKTRVALELARRHVAAFTGGVFFCDLAAVSDPDHVPATVAAAVGVDEGAAEPVAAMLALLADAEALVVLDNAEHVRAVCGELVGTLLRGCAHVRVLATSRAPLGAIGEVDYPLPPLTLPGEAPESAESVELFLTRARSANPRLADDQTTLAAVARICVELDGIPLALELAAARAKMLSLTEIAENLTDRFRFLVSWRRLSPARHQTLREAMDWSFTLLSPQERQGCARLSVFPAGFVLGSAAALWGGDRATALDVIARLGDASLVTADMRSTSTQYRMLETVRQYAAEQLEESGEAEEVRRAHALEVLVFAEQTYEQQLEHLDEWAADMGRRQPDLRAALSWSSTHDAEITARLLQRLWQFWWVRGQLTEGREWIRGALEHADE